MHFRSTMPRLLVLLGAALTISGCTNPLVVSISVSPTAQTVAIGSTVQFTATGVYGHGSNHPSTSQDITTSVTWTSSVPSVATVSSSGVATGVAAGTTTITASIKGYSGITTASSVLTVTGGSTGIGTISGVTALTLIPSSQSVAIPGQTAQLIAIGTTSTGTTVDLTSQAAWSTSSTQIATVKPTSGLVTAISLGSVTITAMYTNPGTGGSTMTATSTFTVLNGSSEQYTAVTLLPTSQSVSASGQTAQFIALATSGTTGLEVDVTDSAQTKWISSIPTVATITSGLSSGNGVVTGVSKGTSTITVEVTNPDGSMVSNTATVSATNTAAPEPLLSLTIIPSSITVGNLLDTGQFLAIGTFSTSPTVRDLTNSVTWMTSAPSVFPVNSNTTGSPSGGANAGIVTAYGNGTATIIAEAADTTTGSIQTATATFSCPLVLPTVTTAGSCYPGSEASALLSTLTIYNEGLNTTNWLVTAPSATGTPDVIHCGPGSNSAGLGASVCEATYPVGTTVTLTAPAGAGAFGGWSYNCTATTTVTAAGPNTCQVTLTFSDTVGAIFN